MASGSHSIPAGSRIAVIGAGALGNAVLPHLVGSPIRKLTIIDGDRVELKNLERQPLLTVDDVGRFKVTALAERLRASLDDVEVVAHDVFLDQQNANSILRDHDVIIEGVDDLHAKAMIDRTCAALRIPLVSGGVHGVQGQVVVLHAPGPNEELGRAQLFPGKAGAEQDGCDMRNVPLELIEAMGVRMTALAIEVLGGHPVVNGRIELLEARNDRRMIIEPAV